MSVQGSALQQIDREAWPPPLHRARVDKYHPRSVIARADYIHYLSRVIGRAYCVPHVQLSRARGVTTSSCVCIERACIVRASHGLRDILRLILRISCSFLYVRLYLRTCVSCTRNSLLIFVRQQRYKWQFNPTSTQISASIHPLIIRCTILVFNLDFLLLKALCIAFNESYLIRNSYILSIYVTIFILITLHVNITQCIVIHLMLC